MVSVVGKQAGQDSNSWEKENKWSEINTVSADCLEWASTLQNKKEEPKPSLAVSLSYRDRVANLRSRRWGRPCKLRTRDKRMAESNLPRGGYSSRVFSSVLVNTCREETTWSQEKNHEKGESHQDRNCSCSQQPEWENLRMYRYWF